MDGNSCTSHPDIAKSCIHVENAQEGNVCIWGKKKHPRTYLNKNAEDVLLRTENFSLPTTLLQTMALLLGWERWG